MASTRLLPLAAVAALALGACSSDVTAPAPAPADPSFYLTAEVGEISLCKVGPIGSSATFAITSSSIESPPLVANLTLTPNREDTGLTEHQRIDCALIWNQDIDALVTIEEVSWSDGTVLETIIVLGATDGSATTDLTARIARVQMGGGNKADVRFKNIEGETPPPPPSGDAGCTPGFWRQAHHHQYWTGAAPGDAWTAYFADPGSHQAPGRNGDTFSGATTMGAVVELSGGGIFALARHAVAALLNANSDEVDYPLTAAEVIALVNGAIASGDYETAKNTLEGYNELGCTVDKSAGN